QQLRQPAQRHNEDAMHALLSPLGVKLGSAVGLTVLLLTCYQANAKLAPVQFASAEEAQEFFQTHGLYCHNGTSGATSTCGNFFVADHPISFADTVEVSHQRQCGKRPEWKGVLWIAQTHRTGSYGLLHDSVLGQNRVWGNVIVAGDPDLMDQVEGLFRTEH